MIRSDVWQNSQASLVDFRLMELFRTLSGLQQESGCRILIPEDIRIALLLSAKILLRICETKIIPKLATVLKIKIKRNPAISMLKDY